ncbi:MAG: hypothetical protein M1816_000046 [Peltula sp. TS41687]|nr:MAG: hypothetical protein M1816_000046 [Peltula sp. TS41687]
MIDSSAIEENSMRSTPESTGMENTPPPQQKTTARGQQGKAKPRAKANTGNKVTKPRAAAKGGRRGSAGSTAADVQKKAVVVAVTKQRKGTTTTATKQKRAVLSEKVNARPQAAAESDIEEEMMGDGGCEDSVMDVDVLPDEEEPPMADEEEDDELEDSIVEPPKKKGRASSKPKVQKDPVARVKAAAKGKKRVVQQEETPELMKQEDRMPKAGRGGRVKKMNTVTANVVDDQEKIIAETQPSPPVEMEMDDSMVDDLHEEDVPEEEPVPQQQQQPATRRALRSPSQSRQRLPTIGGKKGAGSVSDADRAVGGGGDPALRRKLGEMTRKYDNLDGKYRNLHEIGIKEAELNFNKLKKQMEEKSDASEKLISSFQASLNQQTNAIKESRSLEQKLLSQASEMEKLHSQISQLAAKLASTESSNKTLCTKLGNLESDNKSLTAKLAASASSTTRNNNVPASTHKTSRASGPSAADSTLLTTLQGKEALYSDLTGLIVAHMKQAGTSTIYDCIQTGRNGSLHFKLTITQPTTGNYEDTEFIFTPLLDDERDRALIDVLPDYLTEEITFARENAERFYCRVTEAVMKRR